MVSSLFYQHVFSPFRPIALFFSSLCYFFSPSRFSPRSKDRGVAKLTRFFFFFSYPRPATCGSWRLVSGKMTENKQMSSDEKSLATKLVSFSARCLVLFLVPTGRVSIAVHVRALAPFISLALPRAEEHGSNHNFSRVPSPFMA